MVSAVQVLIVHGVGPGVVPYYMGREHPGRWSEAATRLLGLSGPVEASPLRRLLQGRHPDSGRYLPARRPARRRGGWDLIFAAPKSVSVLAASVGPDHTMSIRRAHTAAVQSVMAVLEAQARLHFDDPTGHGRPADGLLTAAFQHDTNSAGAPHLHSHVLVVNLSRAAGAWGPLRAPSWYVSRPAVAALYQLELRHQLARHGWRLEWRLRPDGLADLADTPRAAVRAASLSTPALVASPAAGARAGGPTGGPTGGQTGPGPVPPAGLDDATLERTIGLRLTVRRSDFRVEDVLVALAACHPGGADAWEALGWAGRFCAHSLSVPSPTANPRWTTGAARRADDALVARLDRDHPAGAATAVDPAHVDAALAGAGAAAAVEAAVRALTLGDARVHFLSGPPGRSVLLAQAEVVHAAAAVWARAGLTVALHAPTADAARRWTVLTGLGPAPAGQPPDVLIVDRADRRTSTELGRLVDRHRGRLVFVEGGTLPRLTNPASHGLSEAAGRAGRLDAPPHPAWQPGAGGPPAGWPPVGRRAAEVLLAEWQSAGSHALLVGLGPEEARGLNRAAARLVGGGDGGGLGPGHRVVVLKPRATLPPPGTLGTVVEGPSTTGRHHPPLVVSWAGGPAAAVADGWTAAAVGWGYATTPALAARSSRALMVLGPGEALGRQRHRVVAEVAVAVPGRHRARPAGRQWGDM
ncbi:MAG TPA: MobF family relaxase [Acidimicrobiales bacterium]|nr:MobF family relaxase [Acidimicrobiales bacterium]